MELGFSLVGRAIGGVTDFLGDSIRAASDMNESMSKSGVIFGASAKEMERFGNTAAKSLGISKQAAIEAGASFGNFFTGVGQSQASAEDMSETIVRLASDLASFNNLDPTEVLTKLRSGLTGEAEPLRSVGVFLTAAKVQAKGMQLGLADAHGELSEGAKVLARYQIILDETKTAQGDFARTADGVANSIRSVNAEIEDMKAKIGQQALPLEKAWLDTQLNLFKGINAVGDAINFQNMTLEQQAEQLRTNPLLWYGVSQATHDAALAYLDARIRAKDISETLRDELPTAADKANAAVAGLTTEVKKARPPGITLKGILHDMGYEGKNASEAISDLSSTISEELFGDAINAGNLAQFQQTNAELVKQRDEAKAGSREYRILTGEIAANKQAMFDLQLQMAEEEGPDAVLAFLDKAEIKYGKNNAKLATMIDDLQKVWGLLTRFDDLGIIDFGQYEGKIIPGYHEGGRPAPGEPAIVGEKGPELIIPDGATTVIPNHRLGSFAGTGGASGSPVVINVTLDGAVLARVVDRRLRYASPRSASLPD